MSHQSLRRSPFMSGPPTPPLRGGFASTNPLWIALVPTTLATLAGVFYARLPAETGARAEVLLLAAFLLAAALVTGKQALKTLRHKRPVRTHVFRRGSFWRSLAVGLVISYLAVLVKGANAASGFWLATLASLWTAGLVMGLAVDPRVLQAWQWIAQRKSIHRAASAIQATVLLTVGLELALQFHHLGLDFFGGSPAPLSGVATSGVTVDSAAVAVRHDSAGRLRLAILGDELTCAAANDHALPHGLHLQLPAMQVCDLSKPNFGPREYSRCGLGHLRGACPDVLLVFFSVGQDVATMPLESDWFDWRHLKLADVARSWCHAIESTEVALPSPRDTGALIRELAVCHAPSDEATDLRWKKALTHVGRLHRQCQRANVEMVLVAVPADFQLNGVLLESLRRQAGYARDSVDLTLPQRRLASFAADHQLACIDLLPYLQRCEGLAFERGRYQWTKEGASIVAQSVGGWLQSGFAPLAVASHDRMVLK